MLKNPKKKKALQKRPPPRKVQPKKQPTISNRIVIVNNAGNGPAKETAQAPSYYREPLYLDQSGVIPKTIVLKGEEEPQKVAQSAPLPSQSLISSQQQQMIAQNAYSHGSVSGTLTGLASSGLSPFQGLPAPSFSGLSAKSIKKMTETETPRTEVEDKKQVRKYQKKGEQISGVKEMRKGTGQKRGPYKKKTPQKKSSSESAFTGDEFPLVSD